MKQNLVWLRILSLLLALLMTAALFAACATENNEKNEGNKNIYAAREV
jgi:hypothetical protein